MTPKPSRTPDHRSHPCPASAGSCPALLLHGLLADAPCSPGAGGRVSVGSGWAASSLPWSHALQAPQGGHHMWAGTGQREQEHRSELEEDASFPVTL